MNKQELIQKLDRWLDVLNYWDSEVCECAERINKMGMYHEYEVVQEEMYNLYKELKGIITINEGVQNDTQNQ